jgi:glycosyltransferase involved in cell wall biosynthesis
MHRGSILIVTGGQLSRNPRVLKEATTLGEAGWDVTVLMVRNHAEAEAFDAGLMSAAPFRRVAVDVIGGYSAGWARRLGGRGRRWAARLLWRRFHLAGADALGPARQLLRRARALPAGLTIVHNEAAHWAGIRLMASGRRVAADIEDWHSEDLLPEARVHRPIALLRDVERTLLREARHTTTTSEALADALHARYGGRRPHVVTNSFPLQPDPRGGIAGDPPSFFWFSQTLGPGRGLEGFFEAWERTTRPSSVVLLGEPVPGFDRELLGRLPPSRRGLVSLLPLVPPGALPSVIARHDIGLALEDSAIPSRDLTITNKILQYLNAGLAVVASSTAGQREVLGRSPDAGIVVPQGGPAGYASGLDALLAGSPVPLARRQRAARALAEEVYCWEREAPALEALVAAAMEGGA